MMGGHSQTILIADIRNSGRSEGKNPAAMHDDRRLPGLHGRGAHRMADLHRDAARINRKVFHEWGVARGGQITAPLSAHVMAYGLKVA